MKALTSLSLLVLVLLAGAASAHAQARGVQVTDSNAAVYAVMVTKLLGQQQWAIVADLDDNMITGNVFTLDNSAPPVFLRCEFNDPPIDQSEFATLPTVTIDCFAADACTATPCGGDTDNDAGWTHVGERQIPGSFFLP